RPRLHGLGNGHGQNAITILRASILARDATGKSDHAPELAGAALAAVIGCFAVRFGEGSLPPERARVLLHFDLNLIGAPPGQLGLDDVRLALVEEVHRGIQRARARAECRVEHPIELSLQLLEGVVIHQYHSGPPWPGPLEATLASGLSGRQKAKTALSA